MADSAVGYHRSAHRSPEPPAISTFLTTHLWAIALGAFLLVLAGAAFYLFLSHYQRISGQAFEISILKTLVLVAVVVGVGWLAWWLASLWLAPGGWRYLAFCGCYSLLQSTLGRGVLWLAGRLIDRRYHL
ncbi:MAG TPA: hypothetical protein VF017_14170 [Thermoanaerobaculia bacterium]|nr:hypothetical protein [Thermoanaerobaculia bacterium]